MGGGGGEAGCVDGGAGHGEYEVRNSRVVLVGVQIGVSDDEVEVIF